jgi:hypothetical protein
MSSARRRVSLTAIGLWVGLGASTTACGLIVGAGDYVVGGEHDAGPVIAAPDGDTDAQPQMTPPDSGGPGPDATSQPDTSPPPPPDSGPDSEVDSGPTTDGAPTTACAPDASPLPTGDAAFQQRVKACVLAVTCDPYFFPVTVSECITTDYLETHFATKCLAGITSCNAYYACQGTRVTTLSECTGASSSNTDVGSCNGAVATKCFADGAGYVSNCAALGGTCTVYHEMDYATTGDTGAGCKVLSSCSDAAGSTHCSGSNAYICMATDTTPNIGIATESCAAGSTCSTDTNGATTCLATTSTCSAAGTSCAGDNLTTCEPTTSGLQQFTNACSAAGLSCTPSSGGTPAACTDPGCANSGCTESCLDSTHLQACIGGAPYVVDCASLGFSFCDTASTSNMTYNFCGDL